MFWMMELARSRPRGFFLASGLAVLASGLVCAWIGVRLGGGRTTLWVDDVSTPIAAGIACVLCLRARARHSGRMRLFWLLLSCATACWTLAEVIWGVYALILEESVPSPSWADAGYLAAIPLTVAALVVHPAMRGGGARRARSVFEGLVLATALLFLSWTLILGSLWHSANLSTWAGIVTLAYPFGDVVIVFFIVLTIRRMTGGDRLSLWCLLIGLLAMALSDSTFTYQTEIANYTSTSGHLIDAGWVAAYLGIALAAFSSRDHGEELPELELSVPSLASLTAPLLAILIALSVAAVQIKLGHRLGQTAWLMALGLVALVLLRQGLLIFEVLRGAPGQKARLTERLTSAALGGLAVEDGPSSDR